MCVGVCTSQGRAFARGFVCDHAAPWAVFARHRVPVWGWVCTCTWDRACTGTGCARGQCLHSACTHGNVLARGLGVHLHVGGGLHGAVHAHAALWAMHKSTSLHRSSLARGLSVGLHTGACLHGAVCACTGLCPPGDHAPSHSSCACPLHEALHKSWLSQAWHTPSPGTGHLHKAPCTRLPLHKRGSWAPVAWCSREVCVCPCTG